MNLDSYDPHDPMMVEGAAIGAHGNEHLSQSTVRYANSLVVG
jgi:hypothetical protein